MSFLKTLSGKISIASNVCCFASFVILEASMPKRDALLSITKNHPTIFEFHEFVTITSWIMQLLLNAVLLFKMYKRLTLHGRVMDLVVMGHSVFWAAFLICSSSVLLRWIDRNEFVVGNFYLNLDGCRASARLGVIAAAFLLGLTFSALVDVRGPQ